MFRLALFSIAVLFAVGCKTVMVNNHLSKVEDHRNEYLNRTDIDPVEELRKMGKVGIEVVQSDIEAVLLAAGFDEKADHNKDGLTDHDELLGIAKRLYTKEKSAKEKLLGVINSSEVQEFVRTRLLVLEPYDSFSGREMDLVIAAAVNYYIKSVEADDEESAQQILDVVLPHLEDD